MIANRILNASLIISFINSPYSFFIFFEYKSYIIPKWHTKFSVVLKYVFKSDIGIYLNKNQLYFEGSLINPFSLSLSINVFLLILLSIKFLHAIFIIQLALIIINKAIHIIMLCISDCSKYTLLCFILDVMFNTY